MLFFSLLGRLLSRREKIVLGLLLLLSILVSAVETFAISAVMIFVALATNFETVLKNYYCHKVYDYLGFTTPAKFIVFIGIFLIFFYLLRAALNIFHLYTTSHFSFQRQNQFSCSIFNTFLHFNYRDFVNKNSTQLSQVIFSYSGCLSQILAGLINIFAEAFTILCIYSMLFYVSWKMTFVLTLFLGVIVGAIMHVFSKKVTVAGKLSQQHSLQFGKVYSEAFCNFKFLKLIGRYDYIFGRFFGATSGLARATITNVVWQSAPRFVLETIGFSILIGVIVYVVFMYNNANFILPIVSMYALAFYRFLPSINKILTGYNQIIFNKHVLDPLFEYLKHEFEELGSEKIEFKREIAFQGVTFAYASGKNILNNVVLKVFKGERVAIVGPSGAGKSTMADILMGLYIPKTGAIQIDGVSLTFENLQAWRDRIGYIPQTIYLFDGTIAENVSCGREYDEAKIVEALKRAHLYDFLMTKNGIHTHVGEAGVLLSGGQKQRVAIARALYSDPEVLVLDEATSSLDNEVEAKIMDEIYSVSEKTTLIIIAHRLSTIERCDKVFKIENGCVELTNSIIPAGVTKQSGVSA